MPDVDQGTVTRLRLAVEAALRALLALSGVKLSDRGMNPEALADLLPEWATLVTEQLDPEVAVIFHAAADTQAGQPVDSPDFGDAYLTQVHNRLVGVADTVFDVIRRELRDGREKGETIPQLTGRVAVLLVDEERWANRAETIARTEVIGANNNGAYAAAGWLAAELDVPTDQIIKRWVDTHDSRTRPSHRRVGGRVALGLGDTFVVGTAEMLCPHDPAGPPEEVIDCRCSMQYLMPGDPGYDEAKASLTAGGTMPEFYDRIVDAQAAAGYAPPDEPLTRLFDVSTMPRKLRDYWLHGEGAALIGYGTPGQFKRCQAALSGKVPSHMIDGTCANLIHEATGEYPGKGHAAMTEDYATPPAAVPDGETPTQVNPDECTCCAGSGDHDCPHPCHACDGDGTLTAQKAGGSRVDAADGAPVLCLGHHGVPDPSGDTHEPDHFDADATPKGTPTAGAAPEKPKATGPGTGASDEQPGKMSAAADVTDATQQQDGEPTLTWRGVLAPEGVVTGDKRKFADGALVWMSSPIVLKAQFADQPGHDGSVAVGLITSIERRDGRIYGSGTWDTSDAAVEARRQNLAGLMRGVSVDLDDTEVHLEDAAGNVIEGDDMFDAMFGASEEPTLAVDKGRIRAATLCYMPAYVEAYVLDSSLADDQAPDGSIVDAAHGEDPVAIAAAAMTAETATRRGPAPAEWFANPGLTEPTRLTITDDGRVFGHLAVWGVCHIGIDGQCVTPPTSEADYAYALTGMYQTADGESLPVGTLTMGTGHADLQLGWRPTVDHYDHTGTAAAYFSIGEDEVGIWFAGALDENLPDAQRLALRRAGSVSGDWRVIGGNLELVATLAVNVPGFPIPAVRARVASGAQTSLVASGIVHVDDPAPAGQQGVDIRELAREVAAYQKRSARLDAAARRIRRQRAAALAARITTSS